MMINWILKMKKRLKNSKDRQINCWGRNSSTVGFLMFAIRSSQQIKQKQTNKLCGTFYDQKSKNNGPKRLMKLCYMDVTWFHSGLRPKEREVNKFVLSLLFLRSEFLRVSKDFSTFLTLNKSRKSKRILGDSHAWSDWDLSSVSQATWHESVAAWEGGGKFGDKFQIKR